MSGRLIDADAFETAMVEKHCRNCDDCNGMKCNFCWVSDMLEEIDNAPEAEVTKV